MLGCILYVLMERTRITSLEHYDNHDYGMFSFFYYYETFSFGTHVFTSILFSPLMLIVFGLKSVLVSVFLPFVWLFLGFPMNTIRYLLIITEYLFFIYGLFHFAILVITLILLCKAETLKIIQLVKTHGSYSVTIFIDFISSRVLSQLFLFWVAYFVIALIKELDWGTFVSNFVTDMCRTIVGLASFGAAVIYVSHFLRLIQIFFLHGCENATAIFETTTDLQEGMVFFLIFRFILSKTDFQEHDRNNQVGFILLTGATICLNSVHQMIDSFPAIHIFKSIRVLIMYGLLLLLFLYVEHAVCLLVGFDTFFPIVIMGLSKCIQIIFTIDIYYSISIRGALRSIDRVNYMKSRLQLLDFFGFVVVACVGGFSTIQIFFVYFTLLSQPLECISNSFVLRRGASKSLFRNIECRPLNLPKISCVYTG